MQNPAARRSISSSIDLILKIINWIGYISITGMILATATNVFGRYILKKPLLGEVDLVELGMAVFGGVAMFVAATQRHHVSVDVLVIRFPKRIQILFSRMASLLGFLTLFVLAIGVFLNGVDTLRHGSVTDTLSIPQGPFEIIFSVFIFLFCLTLLIQAFHPEESKEKEDAGYES